jgi:hypothetical protein
MGYFKAIFKVNYLKGYFKGRAPTDVIVQAAIYNTLLAYSNSHHPCLLIISMMCYYYFVSVFFAHSR